MVSKRNKSISIKKYRQKRDRNLGFVIFAIVFLYLIVTVILYLTDDNISVYEVREGNIFKDNSYTGLVIRQEEVVNADSSGYVSYYQNENTKVKSGENVYVLSGKKLDTEDGENQSDQDKNKTDFLDQETQSGIIPQIQNFNQNYDPDNFAELYTLKNEISSYLQNAYNLTKKDHLGTAIEASGMDVKTYSSARDGIISYTIDHDEALTKDTFTSDDFDRTDYETLILSDQTKVKSGDPVYKLITSEDWSVIIPLSEKTAKEFSDSKTNTVKIRIDKDSETVQADFSLIQKDGKYYGCLDFDNSMIRYAEERFLNIDIIMEDESGLKIPKSAVTEKEFYTIPQEYLTLSGDNTSQGVMVEDADGTPNFKEMKIYDISDDGEVCISKDDLSEGTKLIMPDSSETFTVGKTKTLKGVYNINRGYAVFVKVTITCENDEYYIIEEGETYGLSNYDHIVQNGDSVSENEVIFE